MKKAIRVYQNQDTPISSWNIYENKKVNKFSTIFISYFMFYFKSKEFTLSENDRNFPNILQLCSYFTKNDLPSTSNTIRRLTMPYKHYK